MKNGIYLIYCVAITASLLYIGDKFGTSNMFIVVASILGFYFITQGVLLVNSKMNQGGINTDSLDGGEQSPMSNIDI